MSRSLRLGLFGDVRFFRLVRIFFGRSLLQNLRPDGPQLFVRRLFFLQIRAEQLRNLIILELLG